MKHSICFIVGSGILLSGLAGCSKATVTDSDIYVDPVPTPSVQVSPVASIPSLNLGQSDDTCFLDKEIASLRAIPLETNDDCLIGHISDLFIVGDSIVVVDGENAKQIYLYNIDGKFLRKIGRYGTGPEEYCSLSSVSATPECISLYDDILGKYMCYDYSGNVVSSVTLEQTLLSEIIVQDNSTLVATLPSYHESSPFAVEWIESDSVVATAFPYKIKRGEVAPSLFPLSNSEIGLYIPTIDTIYSISGRQIVPKYKLGLISDEEAEQWRQLSARMNVIEKNKYRMHGGAVPADYISVYPLTDYIVVAHQTNDARYLGIVDRSTLQSRNYLRNTIEPFQLFLPPYIMSASGNTLCGYIAEDYFMQTPDESREHIEKHFSEHDQEILNHYDYKNNNPIIWLMELK
ncbi:MAG: 6-bladed beta-propeller [Muribaculaceae bacterium]|nr:6-bladed beta-propeller [Muribaculaceae bacterium]